jgi:hypothetical protein
MDDALLDLARGRSGGFASIQGMDGESPSVAVINRRGFNGPAPIASSSVSTNPARTSLLPTLLFAASGDTGGEIQIGELTGLGRITLDRPDGRPRVVDIAEP